MRRMLCVLDREGVVVRESRTEPTAQAIAGRKKNWRKRQVVIASCSRTGRMAPILFHGVEPAWSSGGLRRESRQAYQVTLKSLATHKTGSQTTPWRTGADLARTGFFKPVHVKSLQAHASPLVDHCAQEVGWPAGDILENQIRGLAVVFGIRLPRRARRSLRIDQALKASWRGSPVSLQPCGGLITASNSQ